MSPSSISLHNRHQTVHETLSPEHKKAMADGQPYMGDGNRHKDQVKTVLPWVMPIPVAGWVGHLAASAFKAHRARLLPPIHPLASKEKGFPLGQKLALTDQGGFISKNVETVLTMAVGVPALLGGVAGLVNGVNKPARNLHDRLANALVDGAVGTVLGPFFIPVAGFKMVTGAARNFGSLSTKQWHDMEEGLARIRRDKPNENYPYKPEHRNALSLDGSVEKNKGAISRAEEHEEYDPSTRVTLPNTVHEAQAWAGNIEKFKKRKDY